jgi:hypothetical protein
MFDAIEEIVPGKNMKFGLKYLRTEFSVGCL